MGRIWSEERRFETWLQVEIAAAEAMAEAGIIPHDAARDIRERSKFDVARIAAIEETTQHDVIAFTTAVAEHVGPSARWLHFGLTSSDVVDTAQAIQMREATALLLKDVDRLLDAVRARAEEHRRTPMMGRTHGVHAEPMTFGLKLALWYAELQRDHDRLSARESRRRGRKDLWRGRHVRASRSLHRGGHLPEARAGARAGVVAGDSARSSRRAADAIAITGASLEKFALEVRGLQKTEIGEVQEPFGKGQKGSSAMPHKRNPDRLRADYGPGAAAARQRARRAREHRALARARHLAFVGRAGDSSRQLYRARSHAAAIHANREGPRRQRRSDAAEPRAVARRRVFGNGPARARPARHLARAGVRVGAAERDALLRRKEGLQAACCWPTRTSWACSIGRRWTTRST